MRRRSFVNHFLEFFYIFVSQSREVARLRGQLASVALRGTGDQISKNHFHATWARDGEGNEGSLEV